MPGNPPPFAHVILAGDDHVSWHPKLADELGEPHRLSKVIADLGLDHQEIEVAVGFLLTSRVGAKEDDLGVGPGRRRQCRPSFVDQVVRCHGDKVAEHAAGNAIYRAAAAQTQAN